MKTVFDLLMNPALYEPSLGHEVLDLLDQCELFDIQNVADYIFQTDPKESWNSVGDNFPNLAPPFENMFFEYDVSTTMMFEAGIIDVDNGGVKRVGIHVLSTDNNKGKNPGDQRWIQWYFAYALKEDGQVWPFGQSLTIDVDNIGRPMGNSGVFGKRACIGAGQDYVISTADENGYLAILPSSGIPFVFVPVLFAISLMHCKNVVARDQIDINQHRGGRRNRHAPKYYYKVLNINPIKMLLQTKGKIDSNGLQRALHICRGHFKDYSENGLFGRFKNIFWWESQAPEDDPKDDPK